MSSTPTLEEIQTWPAAVDLPRAATALGFSKSHAYVLVNAGEFPVKTIRAGQRIVVVTADLLRVLSADPAA